jgi:3-hydroxyacyl-[acyl-carrier-protein] dehydratase
VTTHTEHFHIAADHPALPGHFPGNPIVPGVVLLDHVAAALARWTGQHVAALPQVKFLSPVRPGEQIDLTLEAGATRIRFRLSRNGETVASGEVTPA